MVDGFINVLKPPGMTSHDIVGHLRRLYGMKKIGHAGTLDPAAAGVLPVALGKGTRMLEFMDNDTKTYKVELLLGTETDTGDDTGKVLQEVEYTMPSREKILEVLNSFLGKIKQCPPIYSAIKINGKKACDLARKNQMVEMPEREVEIFSIDFQETTETGFIFTVHCSKGTYIRSLCMDIGKKLGIVSTMAFLIRTQVGKFTLENSFTMEEINLCPEHVLLPVDYPLEKMEKTAVNDRLAIEFKQGKKLPLPAELKGKTGFIRVYHNDIFIGIGRLGANSDYIAPHKVLL